MRFVHQKFRNKYSLKDAEHAKIAENYGNFYVAEKRMVSKPSKISITNF